MNREDVKQFTVNACDKIALQQTGLISDYTGIGYFTQAVGDWSIKVVGLNGQRPILIICARSKRTHNLLKKGRIAAFKKAGLTLEQALKLDAADCKYKFELMWLLPKVLTDGPTCVALTNYQSSNSKQWLEYWKDCVLPDLEVLPINRVDELVKMVNAIA